MKERASKFLELVKEHKTYREIAEIFGCSRTLVYLELHKYFPKEIEELAKETWFKGRRKPAKDFITIHCPNCNEDKKTKYRYHKTVFCSKQCHKEFAQKQWKYDTPEVQAKK